MQESWRAILVQLAGGSYFAWTLFTRFDEVVKCLLGLAMLLLVCHQIVVLRRRLGRMRALEKLVREAEAKCRKAATGECPLMNMLDVETNKSE